MYKPQADGVGRPEVDLNTGTSDAAGYSLRDGAHEGECHTSFKGFGFPVRGRVRGLELVVVAVAHAKICL